jgi:D-alanyl-D-alanine carboxypeptidase (penicillin-binding protein 5/6)
MVKFNRLGILVLAGSLAIMMIAGAPRASATTRHHSRHRHSTAHYIVVTPRHAALLEDADTGRLLYYENPSLAWPPASMAKMMMLLVAEDQIHAGHFSYNTPVTISFHSATTGGSRLGLRQGQI